MMHQKYAVPVAALWLSCGLCLGEDSVSELSGRLDAPGRITTPLSYSHFLGSGRIVSNAPPTSVYGPSHEVWFEVAEALVQRMTGTVVRFLVPTSVYDPTLFPPRPADDAPANDQHAWWDALKLSTQKVYHVSVWRVYTPEPYLYLNILFSDAEWTTFSKDARAALEGRYVWTDPAVLKYREYLQADKERGLAYAAMTNGLISRDVYHEKAAISDRLRVEYEALADPNNPDHLNSGAAGASGK